MAVIPSIDEIREALRREMDAQGVAGKKLSKAAGLSESAVRDLLTKVKDPQLGTMLALADALQIPPGLLFGQTVPVVGLVGVGGIIKFLEDVGEPELVPQPPTARRGLVALKVVGDMLLPAHHCGEILYFSGDRDRIEPDCLGEECAVQLLDGRAFLKTLALGTDSGCHSLRAFNARDMENVQLAWAAPVLFIMRKLGAKNGRNGQD